MAMYPCMHHFTGTTVSGRHFIRYCRFASLPQAVPVTLLTTGNSLPALATALTLTYSCVACLSCTTTCTKPISHELTLSLQLLLQCRWSQTAVLYGQTSSVLVVKASPPDNYVL